MEEAWFLGVRVGFGGREGALASALIFLYILIRRIILYSKMDTVFNSRALFRLLHGGIQVLITEGLVAK